ncbi:MAG: hypothetical protein NTV34_09650 [Proteobacteria bacterium]|nr:hypothetical protein [Pseudomonadota bacterium]
MKNFLLAIALVSVTACGVSDVQSSTSATPSSSLAKKSFCRNVETGGMFGQPKGVREHCIQFIDDVKVTDNANTFFGNPPQTGVYFLDGHTLVTQFVTRGQEEKNLYSLSPDGRTLKSIEGIVLTLTKK